jgi:hypothetical protein
MSYGINLPPFYVGQTVIALAEFLEYRKGGMNTPTPNQTYTVREVLQAEGKWCIRLVEVRNEKRRFVCGTFDEVAWVAKYFIEPIEMVTTLKLEKVIEKVEEFVFPN